MTIQHKGASLFYTDQGKGQPIILLHGFLENSSMWEAFLPELTKEYRVVCIDLLGHGLSASLGYLHTMEEMAAAVKTIIDILQLTDYTIIGHSMGGYVGCAFAIAYPEKVSGLCLLNSTPQPDDLERKQLRKRANVMAQTQYEQLVRMSFENLFDPSAKKTHRLAMDKALSQALQTTVQGYMAANEGMALRKDSTTFWKSTSIKTGMILGKTDWIIELAPHKALFEHCANFFAAIDGGHMPHISNAKETLHSLFDFLKT